MVLCETKALLAVILVDEFTTKVTTLGQNILRNIHAMIGFIPFDGSSKDYFCIFFTEGPLLNLFSCLQPYWRISWLQSINTRVLCKTRSPASVRLGRWIGFKVKHLVRTSLETLTPSLVSISEAVF